MIKKVILGGTTAILTGIGVYVLVSKQQQAKNNPEFEKYLVKSATTTA